jgi:hypothetical protein
MTQPGERRAPLPLPHQVSPKYLTATRLPSASSTSRLLMSGMHEIW